MKQIAKVAYALVLITLFAMPPWVYYYPMVDGPVERFNVGRHFILSQPYTTLNGFLTGPGVAAQVDYATMAAELIAAAIIGGILVWLVPNVRLSRSAPAAATPDRAASAPH